MKVSLGISLCVAVLAACTPSNPPEPWPPEETLRVLSAPGEFPSMNELTAPQGAALRAVNVVVDVPDEYTTHRGMEATEEPLRVLSSFTAYAGYIIAHSESEGRLLRYQGGVWTEYSGTYNAPAGELMSFQESSGALFLTTSAGLYRLDGPTATPVLSGLTQALPGTAALTGASGFLPEGFTTAYRHSWAMNLDAQGNLRLMESAPSPRLLVNNPTATAASRNVEVTWPIPEDLPAGAFNRTFRADAVPQTIPPTDEMRQVYERAPTEAERDSGYFVVPDETFDTVKGAGAYFSANTGEGLAQSNYKAALVHGLTSFNDSMFGITVDGVQRLVLNILGTDNLVLGQSITFAALNGAFGESYTASGIESFPDNFAFFTSGTPAENIRRTVDSLCRAINSRMSGFLYAFPLDTDGTNPGGFLVQLRTVLQTVFMVYTNGDGQGFSPALMERRNADTAERTSGVVTMTILGTGSVPHPFLVNDQIIISYSTGVDPNFPPGTKTVTAITANSISYAEAGPDVAPGISTAIIDSSDAAPQSTSGTAQNAYAWAKQGEPDHWPLANLATVGGATDTLWWGAPLDRFLFLGSVAGLFRLQGNARDGFNLMDAGVWDSTVSFLGRRNVAVLDGQGYAIAREGLVSWSEGTKPDAVDIPIQDEIRAVVAAIPDLVAQLGFMVADETNHRLYVCLPQAADDVAATRCHVLSTRTGAWTRLTDTFPGFEEGFLAGHAPRATGLGGPYFLPRTDEGLGLAPVLMTRSTFTDADYQGPAGEPIPSKVTYLPMVAGEPGRMKQWTWTRVFTKDPDADENTTKLEVGFSTELNPPEEVQLLPDVDPVYTGWEPVQDPVRGIAWKTYVDKFHQRGKGLTVSVGRSIAEQPLHLMGLEVKHRAYGSGQ